MKIKYEHIQKETLERACRKQERKNIESTNKSLSWVSMSDIIYRRYVVGTEDNTITIKSEWREAISKNDFL